MIKLNAVTKKLKNRKVLDEISVTFEEGKLYLLRGHNGSVKTTLGKHMTAILVPTGGTMWVNVRDTKTRGS